MQSYDLIVIGSGPAGQRAAIQAAKCGRRVVVVEQREIVGGVCINTGTIPSKTMREAVLHLTGFLAHGIYGSNYRVKDKITMADLGFRVSQVIRTEAGVTEGQLSRNGIEVVRGRAAFLDGTHVEVTGSAATFQLGAPYVIIATGTKPASSPLVPVNGRNIVNSDQILHITELPRTLIVVGAGVIGVE
jgi:NAD(P) transhydrogenase